MDSREQWVWPVTTDERRSLVTEVWATTLDAWSARTKARLSPQHASQSLTAAYELVTRAEGPPGAPIPDGTLDAIRRELVGVFDAAWGIELSAQSARSRARGNPTLEEELTAHGVRVVWEARPRFDASRGAYERWARKWLNKQTDLVRIHIRDRQRHTNIDHEGVALGCEPAPQAPGRELDLVRALRLLPAPELQALVLYVACGMSIPAMATALGCGVATVHRRLKAAVPRLRQALDVGGENDDEITSLMRDLGRLLRLGPVLVPLPGSPDRILCAPLPPAYKPRNAEAS